MLNLRQLEIFRAVMVAGSLTAAGRRLHMSQPAVSKAVRRMEDVLGFQLFRRVHGRAQPTAEAGNLFREVDKIFHSVAVVEKYARDLKETHSGVLTLACTPTLSCSFVPGAIAKFRRDHPKVRIWLQVTTTKEIIDLAASAQVDVGLIYAPADHSAVAVTPLFETELVCVMSSDHPLADKPVIRPADLDQHAIIANVRNEPLHELLGAAFKEADLDNKVMIGTNSTITACSLVQTGSGIAIVEPMGIRELFPRTVLRPFRPRIAITPRAINSRQVPLSRIGRAFLGMLQESAVTQTVASSDESACFAHGYLRS
ncbi:MAG TPA: LysR substrate-binding domain-containing protein [Beijerinckiaceae bacterium]|nr:LysR substrate-binding domain-containing protein [Beijerinckiaceae bacterium]